MYAINASDIPAYAHSLVSDDADSPTLECDNCGRGCDTYRGAHDEPDPALRAFLEHVAYDHGAPATILEVTRSRMARVLTESYPGPRFGMIEWVAPSPAIQHYAHDRGDQTCTHCGAATARIAGNGETVHLNTWSMACA